MKQKTVWRLIVCGLWAGAAQSVVHAGPGAMETVQQLIAGDRLVLGVVEEVRSDQARIGTSEGRPRFIPMNVRKGVTHTQNR